MSKDNRLQFQYQDGDPYVMDLYKVQCIGRLNASAGDEIAFTVTLANDPKDEGSRKILRLPNMFMSDIIKAFENDDYVLVSDNNGIADAVVVITRPVRFSLADYLNKTKR
jgi:hypothetical protein